jgi:nickel-type superoxide dismutase maturation protease
MRFLLPWQRVRVSGHSMTPTLLDGNLVLVRYRARVAPGQVVLARFRSRPELAVLKRVDRAADDGWLLVSDNRRAGSDSRQYGVADVLAGAVWMWPSGPAGAGRRRLGLLIGHRIPPAPPSGL